MLAERAGGLGPAEYPHTQPRQTSAHICGACIARVEAQNEWAVRAKNLLESELKRKGVSYRDLSAKLTEMGTPMGEQARQTRSAGAGLARHSCCSA
jgi:hypothetical protein